MAHITPRVIPVSPKVREDPAATPSVRVVLLPMRRALSRRTTRNAVCTEKRMRMPVENRKLA